eukprot:scaffold2263_cov76-Skeletonema_dohrnii-CCMP3373.AAC.3
MCMHCDVTLRERSPGTTHSVSAALDARLRLLTATTTSTSRYQPGSKTASTKVNNAILSLWYNKISIHSLHPSCVMSDLEDDFYEDSAESEAVQHRKSEYFFDVMEREP